MRIDFDIAQSEAGKFYTACEAVIRNVGASSRTATELAGWEIMSDSLSQVPIDTGALISSAFLGVSERSDVVSYNYGAVLGYGEHGEGFTEKMNLGSLTKTIIDPGAGYTQNGVYHQTKGPSRVKVRVSAPMDWLMPPTNNVNPKTGLPASAYASVVHEDLDMPHPNGGKAKFLEDPIRNWAAGKFARTAMTYWSMAISTFDFKTFSRRLKFSQATGGFKFNTFKANRYDWVQRGSGVQRGDKAAYKGGDSP